MLECHLSCASYLRPKCMKDVRFSAKNTEIQFQLDEMGHLICMNRFGRVCISRVTKLLYLAQLKVHTNSQ